MNPTPTAQLYERFTGLFNRLVDSPPAWGSTCDLQCGDGWYDLLESLCVDVEQAIILKTPQVVCQRVKQKWGELRVYVDVQAPAINALLEQARVRSHTICDQCGEPGSLVHDGEVQTLCHLHRSDEALLLTRDENGRIERA